MSGVRIGIIGAGERAFALLEVLKDIPQVAVVGISDVDSDALAMIEAEGLSIPTYADAEALVHAQPMDWLINVTHTSITQRYILSRELNDVTIIDGRIAELIWNLLLTFYDQAQDSNATTDSPVEQVSSFYAFSWTVIEQIVANIQSVQGELEDLAFHDPLTELYSRHILVEFLDREISRTYRQSRPLSVVVADIDHFKNVNDRFGHEAGDRVLAKLADLLKTSLRASDLVARYGGEEFVAVLPNADLAAACLWAERMRERVESELATPDGNPVTISLGVSCLSPDAGEEDQAQRGAESDRVGPSALIQEADKAMYRAKRNGRNRVAASEG